MCHRHLSSSCHIQWLKSMFYWQVKVMQLCNVLCPRTDRQTDRERERERERKRGRSEKDMIVVNILKKGVKIQS
ncbi:hypothetical protein T440DRAFT_151516 [Plenodomus tracheiphilus IPT5]|uniref:Uncharacterized protein n=1 Tax=Plenodomus tracheiphilus IPT5 TaxID=1408161 RepID=A0A6A7B1Y6_9PLEO|nr:hypothetical protein T440DRAFT_151516 [Plenodomus tracheiphilus IPT5]